MSKAYVYILASQRNGTLYVGVTNNLARRIWEHKQGAASQFTSRYNVKMLVYYEPHDWIQGAIDREADIKRWNRAWKMELIEYMNPEWKDLYETLNG